MDDIALGISTIRVRYSVANTPIHFRAAHNNNSQREAVNAAKEKSPSPLILKNITKDVCKKISLSSKQQA